jgi:translation initiation factor IF-3
MIDAIQNLVGRLLESNKLRSQDLVIRRKRHKKETKLTAEVDPNDVQFHIDSARRFVEQGDFLMSKQLFVQVSETELPMESTRVQCRLHKALVQSKRFKTLRRLSRTSLPNSSKKSH